MFFWGILFKFSAPAFLFSLLFICQCYYDLDALPPHLHMSDVPLDGEGSLGQRVSLRDTCVGIFLGAGETARECI